MTIKEYVAFRKSEIKEYIAGLELKPHLVIIQVNEDVASNAYVKGKLKDANELGIIAELIKLPLDTQEKDLLELIDSLNNNDDVDGFIVQMPLPKQIDEEKVKEAISPAKDVDGFHPLSVLNPCTPQGIIDYLHFEKVDFVGKNALVIGRSNIVGKPMAKLLLKEHCNVTVVHSRTSKEDMHFYVKHADIVVIAIGRQGYLDNTYEYKDNAIIVDVGISRDETGLHGDALPNLPVKLQTPVPGGVGLLTRLSLLENLIRIYKSKHEK